MTTASLDDACIPQILRSQKSYDAFAVLPIEPTTHEA